MPKLKIVIGVNDLASENPKLAAEWHPAKNGKLTPEMVTSGSNKRVWWKAECGHEWESMVSNRSLKNHGCPFCSNRRVLSGFNDIFTVHPELESWWDYELNEGLNPRELLPGSDKKTWWRCPNGHVFKVRTADFSKRKSCPVCSGKSVIPGQNDFKTVLPDLYKELHPSKNADIDLSKVGRGSHVKLWWIDSLGHTWDAPISDRLAGQGCPYCASKKVLVGYNDLRSSCPEIAAEWHPAKNGKLTPEMVTSGSNKKVWWKCKFGHEWQAVINSRKQGRGCPECAKGLQTSFPEQAIYFYVKKFFPDAINGDRHLGKELDVYIPSKNIAIEYDGYMWHNSEADSRNDLEKNNLCEREGIKLYRFRENGATELAESDYLKIIPCEYRDDKSLKSSIETFLSIMGYSADVDFKKDQLLIVEQFAAARRNKSVAMVNPMVARQWHPTKNGTLTPENVSGGSKLKVWWLCERGHEWQANVCNRVKKDIGCPICSGKKVLSGYNDLRTLMPELAAEWHPTKNESLKSSDVRPGSNKKVWWLCSVCGQEWQAVVNSRSQGHGCPNCSKKSKNSL